jgi:integrase
MTYRAQRLSEVAPATAAKDLRQIKSALSYAADAEWIKTNPAWRWRGMTITIPQKEIRIVEPSEFDLLASAAGLEFGAYLGLCYWQGFRRAEACQVRWPAIRFQPNVVVVLNLASAGELTKSRKNRTVPLRNRARKMLWRFRQTKLALGHSIGGHVFVNSKGGHWKPDTVGARFAKLVKDVGVKRCTLHDLRRSFSTLAQRHGVDVGTVMLLGGWASIAVVRAHYTGDLHGHLSAEMARLDALEKE